MSARGGEGVGGDAAAFLRAWAEVEERSARLAGPSLADRLALCELHEPGILESYLDSLGPTATKELAWTSDFWLRPKQKPPAGEWRICNIFGGRAAGKTFPAATWVCDRIERGEAHEVALVGPDDDDIRHYMVGGRKRRQDGVMGGSGLLDVMPPWIRYEQHLEDGFIFFPDHKCTVYLHSAMIPEFRGPNLDTIWADEIIKWRYPKRLLSNLLLALRAIGRDMPRMMVTTSPKRGLALLREMVLDPDSVTITATSAENRGNIDERWLRSETTRIGGTDQGDEELGGKLTLEREGSLFSLTGIDADRVDPSEMPALDYVVVAIDPAGSRLRTSDMTGIVVAGRAGDQESGSMYVLADGSAKYTPEGWVERAYDLLEQHGATAFVAERNKFADYVAAMLRSIAWSRGYRPAERRRGGKVVGMDLEKNGRRVQIIEVMSTRSKSERADPLATLYAKHRAHHVGRLPELEDEMTNWDPTSGVSPNRLDALVHAGTELYAWDRPPSRAAAESMAGMKEANARLDAAQARSASTIWVGRERSGGRGLDARGRGGRTI